MSFDRATAQAIFDAPEDIGEYRDHLGFALAEITRLEQKLADVPEMVETAWENGHGEGIMSGEMSHWRDSIDLKRLKEWKEKE